MNLLPVPELLSAKLMRNNARLRVLAEVANSFAITTDYNELCDKIANTASDLIGDGCMLTLTDENNKVLVNVASSHRDSEMRVVYKNYLKKIKVSTIDSSAISAQVIRSGELKYADVNPEDLVAKADDNLKALVAKLNVHSYAVVPIRVHGKIIGTLSLVRSAAGRSYEPEDISLLQDLAARGGLAIENLRLYNDLEARVNDRTHDLEIVNKELESFSYSVAHDLRSPLRSIDGYSQTVLQDKGEQLDDEAKELLNKISASAKRMNRLIDDLLNLSQVTRTEIVKQKVNLSELAEDIIFSLKETNPSRQVKINIQPNVFAMGDVQLLEIALTNLLSNAWKFTKKNNTACIEFGSFRRHTQMVYYVKDNGVGFDQAYSNKLFHAFQRLHDSQEFEGTGVGLAITQRVIHRHRGTIWAESTLNEGATFYFTL
ncbi:hypothetical protein CIK05_04690 [Bdellovibrio sp. qaytius]|nr:hypothetical protein CIK05_04690 [Bdellovibrio sp. qaytius]